MYAKGHTMYKDEICDNNSIKGNRELDRSRVNVCC